MEKAATDTIAVEHSKKTYGRTNEGVRSNAVYGSMYAYNGPMRTSYVGL